MGQSPKWQIAYELERRAEQDRNARRRYHEALRAGRTADTFYQSAVSITEANTAWLKTLVADMGWPTISKVGSIPSHRAWQLIHHADSDLAFQKQCLELMKSADKGDVLASDIAYLEDRIAVNEGRPQTYGTQGAMTDEGVWQPFDLFKPESLATRRASVGLPPLSDYIATVTKAYHDDTDDFRKLVTSMLAVMEIQAEQTSIDISIDIEEIETLIGEGNILQARERLSELKTKIQKKKGKYAI